jgi:S1-C subfamily serine protease
VVGINTWIASSTGGNLGLGFAIPINTARRVVDDFISRGKVVYGWLGINVGDPSEEVAENMGVDRVDGAFVYSVFRGSPADRGGIIPGDFIINIDGDAMEDTSQLLRTVAALEPGDRVRFELIRQGEPLNLTVRIAERDEDEKIEARARSVWPGLSVMPITREIREQLNLSRGAGDLVIRNVSSGSPADIAGFQAGDIIKSVNGRDVGDVMAFYGALNDAKAKEIVFNIHREGERIVLGLVR